MHHSANNEGSALVRLVNKNRMGSSAYICSSSGRDQRGPRIETLRVRFWTRKRFEATWPHEGIGDGTSPCPPQLDSPSAIVMHTARMLNGYMRKIRRR